nr:hypothetical protein BaRGS_018332 [Batillaria attramentaria]
MKYDEPKYGMILELGQDGNVLRSLQDPKGTMFKTVGEVEEVNSILYIASEGRKYIGVLNLNALPGGGMPMPGTTQRPKNAMEQLLDIVNTNLQKMTDFEVHRVVFGLIQRLYVSKVQLKAQQNAIARLQQGVRQLQEQLRQLQASQAGGTTGGTTAGGCLPHQLFGEALAPNNWLTKTQPFAVGINGVQSMVVANGYVYTTDADGWVTEVMPSGNARRILRMSVSSCDTDIPVIFDPNAGQPNAKEGACGKPLGIRADRHGFLIVADAYNGIFRISPRTGRYKHLVDTRNMLVNNKPVGYINDVAVARDGTIFFTSSSARWTPKEFRNIIIEGETTGRVLLYSPGARTNNVRQIMADLSFPDGLQLSPDQSYLLVGEGARARIHRVHIGPTPKHGTIEVFASNLPGIVQNIRLSPRGTYWVGLSYARHSDLPSFLDTRGPATPDNIQFRRDLVARTKDQAATLSSKFGIAVELDMNGNLIRSIQDPQGSAYTTVTEIQEEEDVLYVASPDKNFIGLLNVNWLPPPYTGPPPTPAPPPTMGPPPGPWNQGPRPNTSTNNPAANSTSGSGNPGATTNPNPTDPNEAEIQKILDAVTQSMRKLTDTQIREVVVQLTRQLVETKNVIYKANERSDKLRTDLEQLQILTDTSGLSPQQKQLVRDSWEEYSSGNTAVADTIHMFVKFFNITPEAAALFSFVPGDQLTEQVLLSNSRLQSHVQRVYNALNAAVDSLNNIPNLAAVTKSLGSRHASYGVQERFFQVRIVVMMTMVMVAVVVAMMMMIAMTTIVTTTMMMTTTTTMMVHNYDDDGDCYDDDCYDDDDA